MILGEYGNLFKRHRRIIIVLLSTIILSATAIGVQRTILSLYSKQLDKSLEEYIILSAAIALAIYGFAKSVGSYFGGRLSDKFSRVRTSQLGIFTLLMGSIIIALAGNLLIFMLANSIIGLGIGLFFASSNIKMTDLFPSKDRGKALSLLQLSVYMGASIGSFFAGISADISLRSAFVTAFVLVSIAFVFSFFLTETKSIAELDSTTEVHQLEARIIELKNWWLDKLQSYEIIQQDELIEVFDELKLNYSKIPIEDDFQLSELKHPSTLVTFSTGIVSRISDTTFILVFPLLILFRGFSTFQLGILTSIFTMAWGAGMLFSGPLSDRIGRKTPMILGLSVEFIGILLLLSPVLNLFFGFTLFSVTVAGLGRGIYYPVTTSIIADFVTPSHRGQAVGLYRLFLDFGYVIGSGILVLIIEPIATQTESLPIDVFETTFLIAMFFILLQILLLIQFLKDPRPQYPQLPKVMSHLNTVNEGVHHVVMAIFNYFSGEFNQAQLEIKQAKSYEVQADLLLEEMIKKTYRNIWMAPGTLEILKFSNEMDKALSYQLRSTRKLLLLTSDIPHIIVKSICKYVVVLDILVQETVEVISLLQTDIGLAATQSYRVNRVEEILDLLHQELWNVVMRYQEENVLLLILVTQIIEAIEKSANIIEEAAELIRVVATKHSI